MELAFAMLVAAQAEVGASSPRLAEAVRKAGVRLIEHARAKGWRNVGVLRPLVAKTGDGRFRDDCGNLNELLGGFLHTSLLLQPADQPIGVAHDADRVAAGLKGATHLTEEGRRILLGAKYPLAWGDESPPMDAFFSIFASLDESRRELTLDFCVIDRSGVAPVVKGVRVLATPTILGAAGGSFVSRGGDGVVVADDRPQRKNAAAHPADDPTAPVSLEVLYNNRSIPLERTADGLRIPEPKTEKVAFRIHRRTAAGTFGIVLKVNGENVVFRERRPDPCCTKWVSAPESEPIRIDGFQTNETQDRTFIILTRAESREKEVCYGDDSGMITMSVFREAAGGRSRPVPGEEAAAAAAVEAAARPSKRPANHDALLQAIYTPTISRGLIDAGELREHRVQRVDFNGEREPTMCLSIRYYKP